MARAFHADSRAWSNFQPTELVKLCGVPQGRWPFYVLKELLDNALAITEEYGIKNPMVWVDVGHDYVEVSDNGPGMSNTVLENIVDFDRFGGSNRHAKLPTRGAQGNALMTIVGINAAWSDRSIEIGRPCGVRVKLLVGLDQVRQSVDTEFEECGPAGKSSVRVPMPNPLPWKKGGTERDELIVLSQTMARLNPHVTFFLKSGGTTIPFPSSTQSRPVIPENPICGAATWFNKEEFHGRLAADVRARPEISVGAWLDEFYAIDRKTLKTYETRWTEIIGEATDGATEVEFAEYAERIRAIAIRLTDRKKADEPKNLEPVGEDALAGYLVQELGADPDAKVEYKLERGTFGQGGLTVPFIVEACLVQMPEHDREAPAPLLAMNRTALYGSPMFKGLRYREKVRGDWHGASGSMEVLCQSYQIGSGKTPCAVAVHVTCPSPGYAGYGKQSFDTSWLQDPLSEAFERITLQVRKQRAGESRRSKAGSETDSTIREVLWRLIPGVWERDTSGGKDPIMLRQLFYGVRKLWHLHHHKELNYATYCAYLDEYEQKVAGHNICLRDPRGTLIEPHSGKAVRLGTTDIEDYTPKKWEGHTIIFVEKEQFAFAFKKYGITKMYDAIVIGSKGFAVEACREALQKYKKLLGGLVKIVCLHDADPAGYQIGLDLQTNLPRFGESVDVQVYDVGLHMDEAREMGLQDEPFDLSKPVWSMVNNMRKMVSRDPDGSRRPLLDQAAWDAFMPSHLRGSEYPSWAGKPQGRRIELNSMSPQELRAWVVKHLDRIGAKKVRPPDEVVNDELRKFRENYVRNQVGGHLMDFLGEGIVHEILAEIGVPAHDLDAALEMKPDQHWSYLVEKAAQRGLELGPLIRAKLAERMRSI